MSDPKHLFVETSAVLRATLEQGTTPEVEARIRGAGTLHASRLARVEAQRAFHRLRPTGGVSQTRLADAERAVAALWSRCHIWELTPVICEAAGLVAPGKPLRTLDALHLATFLAARRAIGEMEMLTVDRRLLDALT